MPPSKKKKAAKVGDPAKSSEFDRAPGQKPEERNAIKSAEQTRDIPTKHGTIK